MLMCMCMLDKRAQILFDQSLWQTLVDISNIKEVSIGRLVREAVEEKYTKDHNMSSRVEAINRIIALKKQYGTKSVNKEGVVELVKRMREERTEHIWNVLEKNRKKSE